MTAPGGFVAVVLARACTILRAPARQGAPMRLIKIAVASVNPTVGAVRSNTARCIAMAHEMAAADVTVGAFPEQVIGGYAPEDLVQWGGFVTSQRRGLERFATETRELATVFALGLVVGVGGDLYNVA